MNSFKFIFISLIVLSGCTKKATEEPAPILPVPEQSLPLHHLLIQCLPLRIRSKGKKHLRHIHNLRLIVASICLNKAGQDSPNSSSDEPTLNDLLIGSALSRPVGRIDCRLI